METLDLAKLHDTLEMMKKFGAVFLKHGDTIIEFNRDECSEKTSTDAIGFEAQGDTAQNDEARAAMNAAKLASIGPQKPVGYSAIFGDKFPSFKSAGNPAIK